MELRLLERPLQNKKFSSLSFAVLVVGFCLAQISSSIFLPAMILAAAGLHQTVQEIQYALTFFFLGYGVAQFFWGAVSDFYGRKKVFFVAFSIYIVACFAVSLTRVAWLFFSMYTIVGLAAACFTSVGNATIRDVYEKTEVPKKIALVGIFMAASPVIGAGLGAVLINFFTWQSVFVAIALAALLSFVFYLQLVPETYITKQQHQTERFWLRVCSLFSNRLFMCSVAGLSVSFGAFIGFLNAAPALFSEFFSLNQDQSGWLLTGCSFSYFLGAYTVYFLIKNRSIDLIIRFFMLLFLGVSVMLISVALLNAVEHVFEIGCFVLGLFALGALVPLTKSSCMLSSGSYPGLTASMMKGLQTLSAVLFSALVAFIGSSTLQSMATIWVVCGLLFLVPLSFFPRLGS